MLKIPTFQTDVSTVKSVQLLEIRWALKPTGHVLFIYDVETQPKKYN